MALFGGDRSVAVRLTANVTGYVAGMSAAAKRAHDFGKAADQAAGKHKRAFSDLGTGAIRAGLAIGAVATTAVVAFARFDQAMSRAAAGTMATAAEMTALRQSALKAGADTAFSATEAADAITALGKAGVSTRDILGGGLDASLSLAAAGQLEVAKAAEIAATAMTQFGLTGRENIVKVADLLAAGAGKAQGDVTDLANALKYVGPVAASMGVSIEQTTGVLAEFAAQGIIGEQAGTSLRGMLSTLTSPSEQARKTMEALNIQLYDGQGRFLGLTNVASQLQQGLGGLSQAERDAALGRIFGNEQLTAAKVLYKGGSAAVEEWTSKVNDSGYAARQAALLMDNLAGDVEEFKGSLETTLIQSGSGANDGLRTLTQTATGALNAFGALPTGVQKSTIVLGGITAAALLLTAGMLKGAVAVRKMRTDLAELGVTGARTQGILSGLSKVGLAASVLSLAPDLTRATDQKLGIIGNDLSQMSLELANFAKGAALAGDSAKVFGSKFEGGMKGVVSFRGTQSLKSIVNDLSGINGFWAKHQDILGPSVEQEQIEQYSKALSQLAQTDAPTAATAFDRLAKSAGLNGEETTRLLDLMPEYKSFLSQVAAEQVASGDAAAGAADATSVLREQMAGAGYAAGQLAEEVDKANKAAKDSASAFLDARAATRDYQAALDDARASLKENGRTLDNTTPKGRANAAAIDAVAAAAQKQAEALLANGGTQQQYRASLVKSRADLVELATKFTGSKVAAEKLADQLLHIPAKVTSTVDIRTSGASTALRAITAQMNRINGRTVSASVIVNGFTKIQGVRGVATKQADGSVLRAYAGGGMEQHVAQIAPAGAMRLWAEPETGGEAYIPLGADKRGRSKAILAEVARIFGMVAYAEGGFGAATPFGLTDVASRYEAAKPKPISTRDYVAAVNAAKNAALAQHKAERDLAFVRKHTPKDTRAIHDAEDRLDRARRASATARSREADAITRRRAPKGFTLAGYTKALAGTVAQTTAFRSDLARIASRGGTPLAELIESMGADGIALARSLARAKPKDFARVVGLLRKLDPSAFAVAPPTPAGPTVRAFAGGGVESHVAQVAPAGAMRLWAEPETGGEAYIPLSPSKRGTSRMVAADVVARLGGSVAWSSARAGGTATSAAPSAATAGAGAGGPLVSVAHMQLVRGGPTDVANELMFTIRARG